MGLEHSYLKAKKEGKNVIILITLLNDQTYFFPHVSTVLKWLYCLLFVRNSQSWDKKYIHLITNPPVVEGLLLPLESNVFLMKFDYDFGYVIIQVIACLIDI